MEDGRWKMPLTKEPEGDADSSGSALERGGESQLPPLHSRQAQHDDDDNNNRQWGKERNYRGRCQSVSEVCR